MIVTNNNLLLLVLILFTFAITACSQTTPEETAVSLPAQNSDGYTDIDVTQLTTMLEAKDFTFVNVHVPYAGDIPQTDLSIPFDQIDINLNQLPSDKGSPLVVYCRSGNMSTQAAKTLADLGYTNVMEVDGGMNAWQAAGYELVNNP